MHPLLYTHVVPLQSRHLLLATPQTAYPNTRLSSLLGPLILDPAGWIFGEQSLKHVKIGAPAAPQLHIHALLALFKDLDCPLWDILESVHDIVEVRDIGGNRQVVPAVVGHFIE